MAEPAPVSFHLDLYRYWLHKRGSRAMPARGDIDPAEIPRVLPYVAIVQKVEGEYRFRLAGSAIARQFGRELTGDVVGSHVSNREETIAALGSVCERVFAAAHPVFATGQHETALRVLHNVSFLVLPLSDDGRQVNRIIFTRVACFAGNAHASREWLSGAIFKLWETVDVISETDLANRCLEWDRACLAAKEPLQKQA
jgi:hypothetical protein